jgi:hypothetical protein
MVADESIITPEEANIEAGGIEPISTADINATMTPLNTQTFLFTLAEKFGATSKEFESMTIFFNEINNENEQLKIQSEAQAQEIAKLKADNSDALKTVQLTDRRLGELLSSVGYKHIGSPVAPAVEPKFNGGANMDALIRQAGY